MSPTQSLAAPVQPSLARGIAAVALVLFVGFALEALPAVLAALRTGAAGPDGTLSAALASNVAVLIFAWRATPEAAE
jgi:hypothetical protein